MPGITTRIEHVRDKYLKELETEILGRGMLQECPPSVLCAREYLSEKLFLPDCTVSDMKEKCSLPTNNFSTQFKYYLGLTPSSFIVHHRIELAKRLLADDQLQEVPISEIGFAVGYTRPSTFSTTFSRKEGIPPSEWRNQHVKM